MVRPVLEMAQVLLNPAAVGPNPAYYVYTQLGMDKWINMTILDHQKFDNEYNKTFGHYHIDNQPETYHLVSGEGIFLLQSSAEITLVKAKTGDDIAIPGDCGHCLINTGHELLIAYDNRPKDALENYESVAAKHGLAYYIIEENGLPKVVPNPHYGPLPEPKWA